MAKKSMDKSGKAYKKRKRRRILFAVELIILLVVVGGLFVYAQFNQKLDKMQGSKIDVTDVAMNDEIVQSDSLKGYKNIALFGVDSREGDLEVGTNSDTIIIASINNDSKEVRLVSVYRDTYLDIGDGKYTKCNAAYSAGGPKQAISMLNTNLDLDITDYVSVDFDALIETIDALGGLEITVTEEESVHLNNYCIELKKVTGKDYEELPGEGTYDMTGIQATAYARIRYTAGNDFKRTERQREVLTKIVDKVKTAGLPTLNNIMDKVFPMVSTSLSKSDIIKMGMSMLTYNLGEQAGFPFDHLEGADVKKAMNGVDCVVPVTLENNVIQLHQFFFENEEYAPSQQVTEHSQYITKKSGYGEKSIPKKAVEESNEQDAATEE